MGSDELFVSYQVGIRGVCGPKDRRIQPRGSEASPGCVGRDRHLKGRGL